MLFVFSFFLKCLAVKTKTCALSGFSFSFSHVLESDNMQKKIAFGSNKVSS